MSNRFCVANAFLSLLLIGGVALAADIPATNDVDILARDVDRLESVRQVKDLQRNYAHYEQYGLWDEMGSLFTRDATLIRGSENIKGSSAITDWLMKVGGGHRGLTQGALNTEFIDEPLVNLSVDGRSAKARWMSIKFVGDGKGKARIEGGIYENEYARDDKTWKISVAHYYPQYSGAYETGWINEGGADLPVIPYHFSVDETGVPIPNTIGAAAPHSKQSLESLEKRINAFNDEDAVRNLQHAYGYYVDRKMWDDVVDLFANESAVDIHGQAIVLGHDGVRQTMERMGAAGLKPGQLNDHPIFDTVIEINPNGREAISRGIELGMLGNSADESAHWEIAVFRNRFVKENGLWKFKELRLYPMMRADYYKGWGSDAVLGKANSELPAFIGVNPATGKPVNTKGLKLLSTTALTGSPTAAKITTLPTNDRLAEARRKLARSMAYDGAENVSSSYGYYIDDFQWPNMGAIFAEKGSKQSPFAGYYMGRDRISKAATTMYGSVAPTMRAGISFHWRIQPVINVADDGRSANFRVRLFQPRTGKEPATPGSFYGASLYSGMYPNDQAVLENGIWRLWSLEIDEPYFTTAGWLGGWSKVKPAPPGAPKPPPSPLVARMAPDILMTELGRRAEHFRGGTGDTIEWPGILPMWFHYRNPVSGRVPELYWPDCVPCELRPDMSMTKHGYMMPPSGPDTSVHSTPEIAGVVHAGTPVQLVKEGFEAVEGPVSMSDNSLLFTNNKTEQIVHVMSDGSTSIWSDHTGGANALSWTTKGEIVATLNVNVGIAVIKPGEAPRVLVSEFEGKKFNRPNDLIASKSGQIYFTDTAALGVANPALPSAVYQLNDKGTLQRITTDIARPNGVALSPDEHTLYVANTVGEWIVAFELDSKGSVKGHRDFAKLALPPSKDNAPVSSGADGIAVDEKGRLFVATTVGVQVISAKGEALGIITLPKTPQNLAFAGPKRASLYVVGRGAVYRIDTLTRGPHRAGK